MKLRKKKGFTIIELVIVIAVIGVLTAVLVPTFVNLTQRANQTSDQSLVKNLNTAMQAQEGESGKKNSTYNDAITYLDNYGYRLANLATKAGEDLLWNSKSNRFLLNNAEAVAADRTQTGAEEVDYWTIKDAIPEGSKYSIYAGLNFVEDPTDGIVVNGIGFDAGSHNFSKINYTNTSSAKEVVIRTNGGTLTVNASLDTVTHYGDADKVDVIAIANASYHENGTVQLIAVKEGHVKLEGEADVNGVYVYTDNASAGFEDIKITVTQGVDVPKLSRSAVEIADEGTKVCTVVTDQAKDIYLFNEGIYEQIKTVDAGKNVASDASAAWADSNVNTANTQTAAMQLANEFNGSYDGNGKIADKVVEVTGDNAGTYTVKFNQDTREFETYQGDTIVTEAEVVEAVAEVADVSSEAGKTVEEAEAASALKGDGLSWETAFEVYDHETFVSISNYKDGSKSYYFKVNLDKCATENGEKIIDMLGLGDITYLNGSFDGQGVVFKNYVSDAALFRQVETNDDACAVIKNLTIDSSCRITRSYGASSLIRDCDAKTVVIDNVKTYATVNATAHSAALIGYVNNSDNHAWSEPEIVSNCARIEIKNCVVGANVYTTGAEPASLMIGYNMQRTDKAADIVITNCDISDGHLYCPASVTTAKGYAYLAQGPGSGHTWDEFCVTIDGESLTSSSVSTLNSVESSQITLYANINPVANDNGYTFTKVAGADSARIQLECRGSINGTKGCCFVLDIIYIDISSEGNTVTIPDLSKVTLVKLNGTDSNSNMYVDSDGVMYLHLAGYDSGSASLCKITVTQFAGSIVLSTGVLSIPAEAD